MAGLPQRRGRNHAPLLCFAHVHLGKSPIIRKFAVHYACALEATVNHRRVAVHADTNVRTGVMQKLHATGAKLSASSVIGVISRPMSVLLTGCPYRLT